MIPITTTFSLSNLFLSFLFLFSAFIIYYILIPYLNILSYKVKGYHTYFFPILGQIMLWVKNFKTRQDIFAETKESSLKFPNHKVMISNFNNNLLVLIRDPEYAKEFFANPQLYEKSSASDFFKPIVGGGGLAMLEGEQWKRHRKIISNSFHDESLRNNIPIVQKTVKEFFDKLTPEDLNNYSAIDKLQEITGEVVGRIFFGENLNNYTHEGQSLTISMTHLIADLMEASLSPLAIFFGKYAIEYPVFTRFRKLKRRMESIRNLCFKIVRDRKQSGHEGTHDLLASLLETQNLSDIEMRFTDKDIVDEFITFFIAGMDTTGHLTAMILYDLSQHSEHLEILEKERKETYNQEKIITLDTLQKMNELHCVIKETLRLHSPAAWPFYRVALVDHKIGNLDIKKGTWIRVELLALSHHRKHYQNTEDYDPRRWKEGAEKMDPYAFVPFSAGPRNCIGQHLAVAETKIILSEFLERYDWKIKEGYKLKMRQRFLYEPDDELIFELKPR